jgi:hypothetical protein
MSFNCRLCTQPSPQSTSRSAGSVPDLIPQFKDSFRKLISPDFDTTLFNKNFKSSNSFLNSPHDSHNESRKFKLCLFNTNDQAYAALIPQNSTIGDVIHLDKTDPVPSNDAALVGLGYTLSEQYSLNHVYTELFPSNPQASFNVSRKTTEKKIPMNRLNDFNRSFCDKSPRIALIPEIEIASDVDFTQRETQTNVYSQQGSIGSPTPSRDCLFLCSSENTPSSDTRSIPIEKELNTGETFAI